MKNLIVVITLSLLTSYAGYCQDTPAPSTLSKAKIVLKELTGELNQAKFDLANTKLSLSMATKEAYAAQSEVKNAQDKTEEVQKLADIEHQNLIEKTNEAVMFSQKYDAAVKRYHFLKNIAAVIGALLGAFVGFYAIKILPVEIPQVAAYGFCLPILGGILGWIGVWLFL